MIHFNLNIEQYVQQELKDSGCQLHAIATLEYPVLHFIARTIEQEDDSFGRFDHFILNLLVRLQALHTDDLAAITGMSQSLLSERIKSLRNENLIDQKDFGILGITEAGKKIALAKPGEREFSRIRSFLLDGITHEPLNKYFYLSGKDFFISESQKDRKTGKKIMAPSVIFTPPDAKARDKILQIPYEKRGEYNIPQGLIKIEAFDIQLLTFPFGVSILENQQGQCRRKLVNCCEFYADFFDLELYWKRQLGDKINSLSLMIHELEKEGNPGTPKHKHYFFSNNWSKPSTINSPVLNFKVDILCKILGNEFDIVDFPESSIKTTANFFKISASKELLQKSGSSKAKFLDACGRRRDYIRQRPWTGTWLVLFEIEVNDPELKPLIQLHEMIKNYEGENDKLLNHLEHAFQDYTSPLRQMLFDIGQGELYEKYDIKKHMKSRAYAPSN